jgi:hypothetical protein
MMRGAQSFCLEFIQSDASSGGGLCNRDLVSMNDALALAMNGVIDAMMAKYAE